MTHPGVDDLFRRRLANADERRLHKVVEYTAESNCVEETGPHRQSPYPTFECDCVVCEAREIRRQLWPDDERAMCAAEMFHRLRALNNGIAECVVTFTDEHGGKTTHTYEGGSYRGSKNAS